MTWENRDFRLYCNLLVGSWLAIAMALALVFAVRMYGSTATLEARPLPEVNGRVEIIGQVRILRVWGTPRQMGYAHGALMARDIVGDLSEGLPLVFGRRAIRYEILRRRFCGSVAVPSDTRGEIAATFEGIVAANGGTAPRLEPLGRALEADDLLFINSADALRPFIGNGCSGFTVWGESAINGGVLSARNMDNAPYTPAILARQIVLVRQPDNKKAVATITWPGYLTGGTGWNEEGVATFLHDGNGPSTDRLTKPVHSIGLLASRILETNGPAEVLATAQSELASATSPFSYMLRVIAPRLSKAERPEWVFWIDKNGNGECSWTRATSTIVTNHYIPESTMSAISESSRVRYRTLEDHLQKPLDSASAWDALRAVAASSRENATLHAVVLFPGERRVEIALASWDGSKLIPAPRRTPVSLSFETLFARHK